jgi:hypothetical protein
MARSGLLHCIRPLLLLALIVLATPAATTFAQEPTEPTSNGADKTGKEKAEGTPSSETEQEQPPQPDVQELQRRLEVLAAELEQLRSGEEQTVTVTEAQRRMLGLGPAAATVYERKRGVAFAGYGEMLYENFARESESGAAGAPASRFDFLRAILYTGYRFNDRFLFNSEIEVEHAREIWVEFAYVDFKVNDNLALRGGLLLVPLGLVNEFHEPNVFIGARRPLVEQRIIPSTWRENGFGAVGSAGPVNFRAYVVNGFNAAGFTPDGLRGGRQRGAEARASDLAFAGRFDVSPIPGAFVGAGIFAGNSGQEQFGSADVPTTIVEVHGQAQIRGFDVRGLYARAMLDDVSALNAARNLTGRNGIGEAQNGGYAQIGYNLLSQVGARLALTPYYRFERVDTHVEVPDGFLVDPARDVTAHTVGLDVKPIANIVIKGDYQWITNEARTGRNQFNVALGYSF